MKEAFYVHSSVRCHPLPPGMDPARVQEHRYTSCEEVRFIYVGTLDRLRRFDVILDAFVQLSSKNWHLTISTFDPSYIAGVLEKYPAISGQIEIVHASDIDELMEQVHSWDIGIALLPDIALYSSTVPAKVMDYYTCSVPALMTDNEKNRTIFENGTSAYLCHFDRDSIRDRLKTLLRCAPEEIARLGHAGQERLMGMERNYAIMAKQLYETLEAL